MRRRLSFLRLPTLIAALATAIALAACGSPKTTASAPATPTSCAKANLSLVHPGQLTVATDAPAYPPYFENNTPANGKGFESAVAYAVAKRLGFSASQVKWVVEPFDSSYAPGPKSFDFDINEISITKAREGAVDFSTPYYTNPQGIIVAKGSALAKATSLAAFKSAKIGVQIGSTSLAAVDSQINPTSQPDVFNTSNDVVSAFNIHRVNAVITDLATAFEFTSGETKDSTIAGQFSAAGGDNWGLLLAKDSRLTPCVDKAVSALKANGTLSQLNHRWIAAAGSVPVLKP